MCILESFCQFEVRAHVENGFLLKSAPVSRKVISVSEISAVNFMVVLNQLLLEKPQENEISFSDSQNQCILKQLGNKGLENIIKTL